MLPKIKSPLRYPGGKQKALGQIIPHLPENIDEYREPFIGGGSVFLAMKQLFDQQIKNYWINDLNFDLYCFWKSAQNEIQLMAEKIQEIKQKNINGKELFQQLTSGDSSLNDFERAVRFFVLNRITFSGTVYSGGYSQQAYEKRFTHSSIDRLLKLSSCLSSTFITNDDYENVILKEVKNVFIFLDPPYLAATKSKLYGRKGSLHTSFDHERFAENMKKCHHRWLITYDDSPEIRALFNFANITEWTLQYGMNNYKQTSAAKGQELFIKNY